MTRHLKKRGAVKKLNIKTHHDLQDVLLSMSNHHFAAMQDLVTARAKGEHQLHPLFYPRYSDAVGIKKLDQQTAQDIQHHMTSQTHLAKRHKELSSRDAKAGGKISAFVETSADVLKAGGKAAWGAVKKLASAAGKSAQWVLKNPEKLAQLIQLTADSVQAIKVLASSDTDRVKIKQPEVKQHQSSKKIEALLDSSDEGEGLSRAPKRRKKRVVHHKLKPSTRYVL